MPEITEAAKARVSQIQNEFAVQQGEPLFREIRNRPRNFHNQPLLIRDKFPALHGTLARQEVFRMPGMSQPVINKLNRAENSEPDRLKETLTGFKPQNSTYQEMLKNLKRISQDSNLIPEHVLFANEMKARNQEFSEKNSCLQKKK
ncbi:MAG: hypothetical protein HN945_06200 [Deltaproteobacteria bacterium]|nr:hypothetical protein [Deltaproteobacteria bacterium]MBT7152027.1 hypothetical protein [Deltaproteobacteria bacterium]MBT7715505.1 hypothetical protein [Deltaproteobacteria bacterium]